MVDLPELTIVLGPQTLASLALNSAVRENRQVLGKAGISAMPSRLASPLLRRVLDDRPLAERASEFKKATAKRPIILSAVNFLGPPQAGLLKGEMFPDAEMTLAGLADHSRGARIIMAADPLPAFFLAAKSEPLEDRVRRTPWETLYELSWADLIREIVDALPETDILVLTSDGVGAATLDVLDHILGPGFAALPLPTMMLRLMISETGRAVLDRMLTRATPDAKTLAELYESFALRPTSAEVEERLGIDKVTAALLDQRFAEDMALVAGFPKVKVI